MGAAARDDLSRRVGDQYFVHDVLAIALHVAIDDYRASREPLANHHGREQAQFLARVEVAVNVRQIPTERLINGAVEDQRGRERTSERRRASVPWIVVAGPRDVGRNEVGRDVVGDAAKVAADVHLFAIENFVFSPTHLAPLSVIRFLLGSEAIVELGGVDYGAAMAPGANLLDVIE